MKLASLVAIIAFAAALVPAFAGADWNGTWAGNWQSADGNGVQLVMAGNTVTGLFWNGNYVLDSLAGTVSADGKTLTVTWDHSKATVIRDTDTTGSMTIEEQGKPALTFPVAID